MSSLAAAAAANAALARATASGVLRALDLSVEVAVLEELASGDEGADSFDDDGSLDDVPLLDSFNSFLDDAVLLTLPPLLSIRGRMVSAFF